MSVDCWDLKETIVSAIAEQQLLFSFDFFSYIFFSESSAQNFIAQVGAIHRVGKNLIAFASIMQLKFPC